MADLQIVSDARFVTWPKIAEAVCSGNDIEGPDLAAFVDTPLVKSWLSAYSRRVENVDLYPVGLAEFLGRAFYLFQLGADLNLLELMVNRPYLVIALVSGMVDAIVTMDEDSQGDDE